ncbi:Baseplate J-like protein [compost metagenome]
MGLNVRSFQQSLRGMVDWTVTHTRKITDFSVGSAIRTLYEAVASEIEMFYFTTFKNINWGIENSIFESFDFKKFAAHEASGFVTLTFYAPLEANLYISKGTKFSTVSKSGTDILYYATQEDYVVQAGSVEADIEVFCTVKGTIGNVAAGSIRVLINPINYVQEVTNKEPFLTGAEEETQAERKQRFNVYIETLARGTKKSIEYGVKEVEGVAGVWVDDSAIGLVNVYVHDANGNLPDSLKEKVIENLVNYRAAGIPVYVNSIVKTEIPITLTVKVLSSYNNSAFHQRLVDGIQNYVNSYPVAKSFYVSDLIQYVMNYDDVAVINCKVSEPLVDKVIAQEQIVRASAINLTLTV